jgi:hypothetical protein
VKNCQPAWRGTHAKFWTISETKKFINLLKEAKKVSDGCYLDFEPWYYEKLNKRLGYILIYCDFHQKMDTTKLF